jgi:uncharacterized protein (TIGR02594 family)
MSESSRIYQLARNDLGLSETEGKGSNPRIAYAIKAAADWLDRDDSKTAWCGCIRGLWGIETGTGVPKDHYRAISWLNWGTAIESLKDAEQGDTIVFKRPGGFHVALLDSPYRDGDAKISVLGGNQSNSVSIAKYKVADIRGVRRG